MKKTKAFTIYEVTIVLAILSILLGIITTSLNRFNEQLKLSSDLNQELSEFYTFRSNLWRELMESDSMAYEKNHLTLFHDKKAVHYRVEDEMLERKTSGEWMDLNIPTESIEQDEADSAFVFNFNWKNEIMKLSYVRQPVLKTRIDHHFENIK